MILTAKLFSYLTEHSGRFKMPISLKSTVGGGREKVAAIISNIYNTGQNENGTIFTLTGRHRIDNLTVTINKDVGNNFGNASYRFYIDGYWTPSYQVSYGSSGSSSTLVLVNQGDTIVSGMPDNIPLLDVLDVYTEFRIEATNVTLNDTSSYTIRGVSLEDV